MRSAIAAGIGMFLALIGLKSAGVVVGNQATLVVLGDRSPLAAPLAPAFSWARAKPFHWQDLRSIVFPCLLLNYFGQAAFILSHGEAAALPFFQMMPGFALWPMVLLATAATVIASQAVISGAFSVARQAVQLNILPRLEIQHTSEKLHGQIYIPRVNLLLGLAVVILVLGFERSARTSERQGRAIDRDEAGSMEKKKREGYF